VAETLLVSLYLGWIIQAFALQQMFDYIHIPGLILAMAVCSHAIACGLKDSRQRAATMTESHVYRRSMFIPVAIGLLGLCIVTSPVCRPSRQQYWLDCVDACIGTPLMPQVKDDLALCPLPRWTELQPLLDRIRELAIPDRSVMAYSGNLVHLYPELRLHPPTRFVYLDTLARCFPGRRPEMLAELEQSGIRYVVCHLIEDGWEGDLSGPAVLPLPQPSAKMFFPYNQTPIFRSGSYVLFEVNRPIGWLTSEHCPLSPHGSCWTRCGAAFDD
jgi:hypothetical protein